MVTSIGPRPITDANNKLVEKMKAFARHYNWDSDTSKKPDSSSLEATKFWDDLQSKSYCCGIYGIGTWDETRPANVSKQYYPTSCCLNPVGFKCEKGLNLMHRGCMYEISNVEDIIMLSEGASIGIGIVISILTFIVGRE